MNFHRPESIKEDVTTLEILLVVAIVQRRLQFLFVHLSQRGFEHADRTIDTLSQGIALHEFLELREI